jgi:hypothetical protein
VSRTTSSKQAYLQELTKRAHLLNHLKNYIITHHLLASFLLFSFAHTHHLSFHLSCHLSFHLSFHLSSLPFPSVLLSLGQIPTVNTATTIVETGRRAWSSEADERLKQMYHEYSGKIDKIQAHFPNRTRQACKDRFSRLRSDRREPRKGWSSEDDSKLLVTHRRFGGKWDSILAEFSDRTKVR